MEVQPEQIPMPTLTEGGGTESDNGGRGQSARTATSRLDRIPGVPQATATRQGSTVSDPTTRERRKNDGRGIRHVACCGTGQA